MDNHTPEQRRKNMQAGFICITPSQRRMLNAKKFFTEELKKLSNEWKADSIDKRHSIIVSFAKSRWAFIEE